MENAGDGMNAVRGTADMREDTAVKKYAIPGLKLGGTSFLLHAGYVPAVRFAAERCEDVALLLLETGARGEWLPTPEEIREIGRIADGEGAGLHVHLPTDADFDTPEGARAMVAKVRLAVERAAPLRPHTFVLHVDFPSLHGMLWEDCAGRAETGPRHVGDVEEGLPGRASDVSETARAPLGADGAGEPGGPTFSGGPEAVPTASTSRNAARREPETDAQNNVPDLPGGPGGLPVSDAGRYTLPAELRCRTAEALREIAACLPSPAHLAVENLENFPPDFWDGWIDGAACSRCLDVGHIWKDGGDPAPVLEAWLPRVRVVHLHGLEPSAPGNAAKIPSIPVGAPIGAFAGNAARERFPSRLPPRLPPRLPDLLRRFGPRPRDHKSLRLMPPDRLDAVIHPLWKAGFSGVLNLEVFAFDDFIASLAALLRSWERYAETSLKREIPGGA